MGESGTRHQLATYFGRLACVAPIMRQFSPQAKFAPEGIVDATGF